MSLHDPRKPDDVCYHGTFRCTYRVLWRDGPDWRVEWEDLRPASIPATWCPDLGDRIIRSGGWNDPQVVQLQLF